MNICIGPKEIPLNESTEHVLMGRLEHECPCEGALCHTLRNTKFAQSYVVSKVYMLRTVEIMFNQRKSYRQFFERENPTGNMLVHSFYCFSKFLEVLFPLFQKMKWIDRGKAKPCMCCLCSLYRHCFGFLSKVINLTR